MSTDPSSLPEYVRKRDFRITPEPTNSPSSPGNHAGHAVFVVQKHLARNLHYDLRLEMDGILKSWAVPKGPSLDPSVKRMAIQVEDHPLDYARFEGVIPDGQYGAGKVIVWDAGEWKLIEANGAGFERGNLKFELHGEKLRGKWALVRLGDAEKRQWLLIKERDSFARSERESVVTNQLPLSILTGRDVNEVTSPHSLIAASKSTSKRPKSSPAKRSDPGLLPAAVRSSAPGRMLPQLATATPQTPEGHDWLHEIKLDGYRLLAKQLKTRVELTTRNGLDWTNRFPSVAAALEAIKAKTFVIDGELVRLRSDGVSDFAALQTAIRDGEESQLVYFAFDLLYLEGYSLIKVPLIERKSLLADVLATVVNPRIQFCDHIVGNGAAFYEKCRTAGLEGVISKKVNSRYQSGRNSNWLKRKCLLMDDFVILGYTRSENRRDTLRSLVLGYYDQQRWQYAGKVGTGFSESMLQDLKLQCDQLRLPQPAVANLPSGLGSEAVVWCRPTLVARVHYLGWTSSHQLRHASFVGLRSDTDASQVPKPTSGQQAPGTQAPGTQALGTQPPAQKQPSVSHVTSEQLEQLSSFTLTNPNKIIYPSIQCSKLDIAKYYVSVSPWMLPYIENRPTSLVRCPDGIEQPSFFQKHPLDGMPSSMDAIKVGEDEKPLLVVSNLLGLMSAVQLASLEFHPWSARKDRLDRPDRVIFDFDPDPSVSWNLVKDAAFECHELLRSCGLASFAKTSGGKGIHVVVPIGRRSIWSDVLEFAKAIARQMEIASPAKYTRNASKSARENKIFIDVHRNHRGATCVAAYSLRAKHAATVSTPLEWKDLRATEDPHEFDISSVSQLVAKRKHDPWSEMYTIKQSLTRKRLQWAAAE